MWSRSGVSRWVTSILDICSVTLGFFLFRSQNKKSWRPSSGGTWKNFSHSLNCCFSQGSVLETVMINTEQGSAVYQVDAGLCFLGLPPGCMGMGIVWSRSGVWEAHGMTWTQQRDLRAASSCRTVCGVLNTQPSPVHFLKWSL